MGLSNNEHSKRTYLSIGYGKIRQKVKDGNRVDANTPGAILRKTEDGSKQSYAIEYSELSGKLVGIFYREAQNNFPASYEVIFDDFGEQFQLSLKDEDSITYNFLGKLPNINMNDIVVVSPYDFKDKATQKTRKGISVKQSNVAIENYYVKKEGEVFKYTGGFPEPTKDTFSNEKKRKIYNIELSDFFLNEFKNKYSKYFQFEEKPKTEQAQQGGYEDNSDLPF